jgi:hypothetical protein
MPIDIGRDALIPTEIHFPIPEIDRVPVITALTAQEYDHQVAPWVRNVSLLGASGPFDIALAVRCLNGTHVLRLFPGANIPGDMLETLQEYSPSILIPSYSIDSEGYTYDYAAADPWKYYRPAAYYIAQNQAAKLFPTRAAKPEALIVDENGRPFAVKTEFINGSITGLDALENIGGRLLDEVRETLSILSLAGIVADLEHPTSYVIRDSQGNPESFKLDNLTLDDLGLAA